jgi:photosystem II stability/assembly factor-like uncharacterized protein
VGGWIDSLTVSPHDPNRVLVGGDILGIGLSLDGGESWLGTYGLKCWELGDFTWHPADPAVVWAGTMGGPYVSRDGGRNWTSARAGLPAVSGWTYSAPIQCVRFDPNDQNRLLAFGGSHREYNVDRLGEWGAVWESVNGGTNWARISYVQQGSNVMNAAFGAGSSTRVYAGVNNYGPVVSDDGGRTWQRRTNGLPSSNVKDLTAHPTDPNTAYVALWNSPNPAGGFQAGGIWATTNAGLNWQARNVGIRQNTGNNGNFVTKMKAMAVAPTNPQRLATSDNAYDNAGVYVSSNAGVSWTKYSAGSVAMPSGGNFTGLSFSPNDANTLFVFGSEYLLRSTNGGATWSDLSSYRTNAAIRGRGYSGWVTTRFAFHPTDPTRSMFAGLDHGFGWQSRDGMQTWMRGSGLETWNGAQEIAWATNDHIFLACGQFGNFTGIARSQDGGGNFTLLYGAARGLPDHNLFDGRDPRSLYCFPDDPTNVWAVIGAELYATTNNGDTWYKPACGPDPRRIAGDPRGPRCLYVTCSDGVYWATPGGVLTKMTGSPANGGCLTVDALGRLYVLPWRATNGGLWRYETNRWNCLRGDMYLQDVAVDPANPRRLMTVSNDDPYHDETSATGVWTSEDDGQSWHQQNKGLAQLRVETVAVSPHDPDLWIVGTGGRGYFITRWADILLRREGATAPPVWRLAGPPNQFARIDTSVSLPVWQPLATNQIPAAGWVFPAVPATSSARFYRAMLLPR